MKKEINKTKENKRFNSNPKLIMYFLRGSKRFFVASIISSLLVTTFELINPRIIAYTVDTVIGESEKSFPAFLQEKIDAIGGPDYIRTHLYLIALLIVAVAVLAVLPSARCAATAPGCSLRRWGCMLWPTARWR